MITAPFNFVPLNKEVFFPTWSDEVSLDIPFEDEISGEIDIKITAVNPIFVRDSQDETKFFNYNGEYYIPSTSVKGMVRSVLEILSFSKLNFFDDKTYAVRDLNNKDKKLYRDRMTNVKCGWLSFKDRELIIEDCGEPYRIRYDEIDRKFGVEFKHLFMKGVFDNSNSPYKKAKEKYRKLQELTNMDFLTELFKFNKIVTDANREVVEFDESGDIEGKIVLTGHPSARDENRKKSGKVYDFVFPVHSQKEYKVSEKVFEDFKFAYFDGRDTDPKESEDWKFWKEKLNNGEKIPVFFQLENNQVAHFGLSYLYKLPYKFSIEKGIPDIHKSKQKDLAETIFGYTDKNDALKGRVYFSHFKAVENVRELPLREVVLGTPRASYYPIYIRQNGRLYKTYMDGDFSIAGRKRYPVRSNIVEDDNNVNENIITAFRPLNSGVVFKGKMRFHNLKKVELGAILSALTFHNCDECYHSIGLAKPYGYGVVKVEVNGIDIIKYLKEFEILMRANIDNWLESDELRELFTMAVMQNNSGNSRLEYMELKDFAKNKKNDEYLDLYSRLDNIKIKTVSSVLSSDEISKIEEIKKRVEIEKKEQEEREKAIKLKEEYENDLETIKNCEDISKLNGFILKYKDKFDVSEIENKIQKLQEENKNNKFKEINDKAKKMFDEVMSKKGNQKAFNKAKEKFIKKYSKSKENKGSEFVLELLERLKNL